MKGLRIGVFRNIPRKHAHDREFSIRADRIILETKSGLSGDQDGLVSPRCFFMAAILDLRSAEASRTNFCFCMNGVLK